MNPHLRHRLLCVGLALLGLLALHRHRQATCDDTRVPGLDGGHAFLSIKRRQRARTRSWLASKSADGITISDGLRRLQRDHCLASVRQAITDSLRPHFARTSSSRIALLGVPVHGNLGDNVLHLAEAQMIANFGTTLAIECTPRAPQPGGIVIPECPAPSALLDMLGADPLILFHAGGNWGDIWQNVQPWRMAYLSKLDAELRARNASARVVQLPQSLFYLNESTRLADIAAVKALRHIDLTLYARQASSLAFAPPTTDRVAVKLMPDMAFLLNPVQAPEEPEVDVLFLLRTDRERRGNESHKEAIDLARSTLGGLNITYAVRDWVLSGPLTGELAPSSATGFALSRWVAAQRVVGSGRVVITDRLHASLVALLLDRPHIMVDNMYRKVSGVRGLALDGRAGCEDAVLLAHRAPDVRGAVQVASRMVHAARADSSQSGWAA